ncbi:MAG: 4a-hydroxytetrahydrobiopterin dehydratase, partial [Actinobacteria bacterium]|nr:4a-hydroxytetrahydrobiopterin dehydratase [Actinomycetota bacterium]
MVAEKLADTEIEERLRDTDGWTVVEGKLHKELTFADFNEAFGFLTRLALAAEKLDHHPDWSNSWNRVVIDISSHAAGGITA